jgi:hypothetical protein
MAKIIPAVDILESGARPPVGYQEIPCHIVFNIKMDFTRKARYVAGGHVTEPPASQTYASVVSRESVRIALLVAALNDLDVLAADVAGAYLNAPVKEKVYTRCGDEFGPEHRGKLAVVRKALYGLKTSAFAWREALSNTLHQAMKFKPCRADPDVWLRPATKDDGCQYYEYILVYTDNILVVSHRPLEILTAVDQHYLLKADSIGPPKQHLGSQIGLFHLPDDPKRTRWSMSSENYVKEAIRNVKSWLDYRGHFLKSRASSVLPLGYRPELDTSQYCTPEEHQYYQEQLGVLRWAVELGRVEITAEVSMLAAFCAAPREGHFDAMLHIFAYLDKHPRSRLVFDDTYINITDETEPDWTSFYPEAKEEIPPDAPAMRGKPIQITCFVDADHAGDALTRRSRTGVFIYCNRAPILWYSKKQNSIETSIFGSEFTALKTAVELIKGLRYKLRMMGIPLDGHAHVRVDNMSVVNNTTAPESTLKKKSNAIAYHFVQESVAAGIIKVGYETSKTNIADMLTKIQ